jgi:hypothetical protein
VWLHDGEQRAVTVYYWRRACCPSRSVDIDRRSNRRGTHIEINVVLYSTFSRLMTIAINHSICIMHMSVSYFVPFSFVDICSLSINAVHSWTILGVCAPFDAQCRTSRLAVCDHSVGKRKKTILATTSTEYIIATGTCSQPPISLSIPAYCILSLIQEAIDVGCWLINCQ